MILALLSSDLAGLDETLLLNRFVVLTGVVCAVPLSFPFAIFFSSSFLSFSSFFFRFFFFPSNSDQLGETQISEGGEYPNSCLSGAGAPLLSGVEAFVCTPDGMEIDSAGTVEDFGSDGRGGR